jgi:autotransporter translocation and assembly factor TamB
MNTARVRRGMRLPRSATMQLAVAVAGLATGGVCRLLTLAGPANVLWAITAAVALVPATISMARDLLRRRAGVDIVAVLALLGSLVVAEYLAVSRRTSQGLSKREILRCLKRYIAREVFQVLPRP